MPAQRKIMIVDDEFDIIQIVRRFLERWGYSVDTFMNPLYALEQFKKDPEAYWLGLIDIRMPEITGIKLASLLQKVKPDLKVVTMTAYEVTPDELQTHLPTISRNDILQKPFKLSQVCSAVKKQLQTA